MRCWYFSHMRAEKAQASSKSAPQRNFPKTVFARAHKYGIGQRFRHKLAQLSLLSRLSCKYKYELCVFFFLVWQSAFKCDLAFISLSTL